MIGLSAGGGVSFDEKTFFERHGLLIAVILNLGAAIASLSRAAILLCAVVFLVLSVYMIVGVWQKAETGGRAKVLTAIALTLFLITLSLTVFAPKALKTEIATITPAAVFDRVSGRAYYHARVAKEIFSDHPVFGVGGWGYPHYLMQYLTPEETKIMQIQGGANVHNDSLQFLAEQGAVGYGLMVLCVLVLVVPLVWQAVKVCRTLAAIRESDKAAAKPVWLYRLPPELVALFVGTAATVCHSLGDLPFRSPAVLTVWVLSFVCASGFLPAVRRKG